LPSAAGCHTRGGMVGDRQRRFRHVALSALAAPGVGAGIAGSDTHRRRSSMRLRGPATPAGSCRRRRAAGARTAAIPRRASARWHRTATSREISRRPRIHAPRACAPLRLVLSAGPWARSAARGDRGLHRSSRARARQTWIALRDLDRVGAIPATRAACIASGTVGTLSGRIHLWAWARRAGRATLEHGVWGARVSPARRRAHRAPSHTRARGRAGDDPPPGAAVAGAPRPGAGRRGDGAGGSARRGVPVLAGIVGASVQGRVALARARGRGCGGSATRAARRR